MFAVVVVSKTFTTAETMLNARTLRTWITSALGYKFSPTIHNFLQMWCFLLESIFESKKCYASILNVWIRVIKLHVRFFAAKWHCSHKFMNYFLLVVFLPLLSVV